MKKYLLLLLCTSLWSQERLVLFFDFDADNPNDESLAVFDDWADDNRNAQILSLTGFADSVDASGYNVALSSRRIRSVIGLLKSKGIEIAPDLKTVPRGEDFEQSARQQENRKVEIVYKSESPIARDMPATPEDEGVLPNAIDARELQTKALSETVKAKFENARKGDLIRIHNINFYLNSEKVIPESAPVMEDLLRTLKDHRNLRIEIHGHICCNPDINDTRLSYRRAKFIFEYLRKNGIPLNRLAYKGFGSGHPIFPVPENNFREEQANRRVEILVVDTNAK
jgi:outer membrane protein OmpA-like peptidoglycan-associated protein